MRPSVNHDPRRPMAPPPHSSASAAARLRSVALPILLASILLGSLLGSIAAPALLRSQESVRPPQPGGFQPQARPHRDASDPNRERWESLAPEKQRKLREVYDRLSALPPGERAALLDRLRGMSPEDRRRAVRQAYRESHEAPEDQLASRMQKEFLRRQWPKLPPEERQRLKALPPEERPAYLLQLRKDRRERLLDRLPPPHRDRARALPPQEQAQFLRLWRAAEAARSVFVCPEEISALRALPRRDVIAHLLPEEARPVPPGRSESLPGVRRPAGEARPVPPRPQGPPPPRPPELSEETWERWQGLKPFEKPRVLRYVLNGPRTDDGRMALPPLGPRRARD